MVAAMLLFARESFGTRLSVEGPSGRRNGRFSRGGRGTDLDRVAPHSLSAGFGDEVPEVSRRADPLGRKSPGSADAANRSALRRREPRIAPRVRRA